MFAGIIRHLGAIKEMQRTAGGARIGVLADTLAAQVIEGASVCVNGVCLTVARVEPPLLEFDVIPETLRRSTLETLRPADRVNLEPSLRVQDTIDGHFVQGHVDGTARLVRRISRDAEYVLWFEPQPDLMRFVVPKGSVAVDGVSLTVAEVDERAFAVALIPTTLKWTTLADIRVGEFANIETDILARTVVHYLESMTPGGAMTMQALREQGFA